MTDAPPRVIASLIAQSGFDLESGLQIAAIGQAPSIDPTRPAILLVAPDGAIPAEALEAYPPETAAHPLAGRDGRAAGALPETTVADLAERGAGPGVAALALPAIAPADVQRRFSGLRGVIARLRDPESGCPWDLAQDHRSLRPHLLEEAYEALAALDRGDAAALEEELGDLLMQILLHAQIAHEAGTFSIDDVSEGIRAKLVARHPHVFGDLVVADAGEVVQNWERLKAEERDADASPLDGVPAALPALARAQSLTGRAARNGYVWPDREALLQDLGGELRGVASADAGPAAAALGDLLFLLADWARRREIDAESALREAGGRFERRIRALERTVRAEGRTPADLSRAELLRRWEQIEAGTAGSETRGGD